MTAEIALANCGLIALLRVSYDRGPGEGHLPFTGPGGKFVLIHDYQTNGSAAYSQVQSLKSMPGGWYLDGDRFWCYCSRLRALPHSHLIYSECDLAGLTEPPLLEKKKPLPLAHGGRVKRRFGV